MRDDDATIEERAKIVKDFRKVEVISLNDGLKEMTMTNFLLVEEMTIEEATNVARDFRKVTCLNDELTTTNFLSKEMTNEVCDVCIFLDREVELCMSCL